MGMGRDIGTCICKMQATSWKCAIICQYQTVFCEAKVAISTLAENVLEILVTDADESEYPLRPCTLDRFDTRVMLHAANAVSYGYKCILIIANGTVIIGLGISFFGYIGVGKLWLSFGIGNKWQNISIYDSFVMHLMYKLETPSSDDIAVTESYAISLYSVSRILTDVNQTDKQIFSQSSSTFEYLPPTKSAWVRPLKERHTKLKSLRKCCLAQS